MTNELQKRHERLLRSTRWFCRVGRVIHRNLDAVWLSASMAAFGQGLDSIQWWIIVFPTLFLIGYSAEVRTRQND